MSSELHPSGEESKEACLFMTEDQRKASLLDESRAIDHIESRVEEESKGEGSQLLN